MVAFVDAKPAHLGLAYRVGVLECGQSVEISLEAVHDQVDLHLADLGNVVVLSSGARLQFRNRMANVLLLG